MDIFMMGKYSAHVWSSFGITAIVIAVCVLQARRLQHNVLQDIRTRLRATEADQ